MKRYRRIALVTVAMLPFCTHVEAQDRSSTWIRVQQSHAGASMSADAALAGAAKLQAQLNQSAQASLRAAAPVRGKLNSQQTALVTRAGRELARDPNSRAALRDWEALVVSTRPAAGDVNALVQSVLREAYLQQSEDLKRYADKVKQLNEQKAKQRDQKAATTAVQARPHNVATSGASVATPKAQVALPVAAMKGKFAEPERKFGGVGDDAQLANVDLQNALQKQQQTMQMLSNIAKKLQDTAAAVIRKIGG